MSSAALCLRSRLPLFRTFGRVSAWKESNAIGEEVPLEEVKLDKAMLDKLERVSLLRFTSEEEILNLEEDIRLASKIFEVDTQGVEPLYSIVEEFINCPLRDDEPTPTDKKTIMSNAVVEEEDYFVTPPPNIELEENSMVEQLAQRRRADAEGQK
ncbi:aspartyl/glutamyl-tRNA(Asn/Gln) amidotransferase subunit C [Aphelenchoides avenae]|nr:aspartyl/glutamyl-tRNA(Asn/Gln) amidotransferase subunit C [Aphelenchus avenae]